jgi:hypothetical protein
MVAVPKIDSSNTAQPSDNTNYFDEVAAYLAVMILYQLTTAKNESKLSQMQSTVSQSMVEMAEANANATKTQLEQITEALQEQQNENFWQQTLGILASVVGVLLAGLTGGLAAGLIAVGIALFMNLGGQDALNNGLSGINSDVGQFFAKIGIIIAASVVAGGAAGGVNGAVDGAEGFSQGVSKGLSTSNLMAIGGEMTLAVDPGQDLVASMIDLSNAMGLPQTSEEKKKEVAQIAGMVTDMVAALTLGIGSSYFAKDAEEIGGAGSKLNDKMKTLFGADKWEKILIRTKFLLGVSTGVASGGLAYFDYEKGQSQLKQADAIEGLGTANAGMQFSEAINDQFNTTLKRESGVYDGLMKSFETVNQANDQIILPFVKAGQFKI